MPFTLIKGEFVPEAGRPDGDSIRFRPNDPDHLLKLTQRGKAPKINQTNRTIQLRFEGIDTVEYKVDRQFDFQATNSNLELCGVPNGEGTARGYILSNQCGPYGRPIAFVYHGDTDGEDGSDVFLDSERMKESVNYLQIERGYAYPLFYDTLYADLRRELAARTVEVRDTGQNIWASDATNTGATYSGPDSLTSMPPFFPKLWRRLDKYSRDSNVTDHNSLLEFKYFLEILREERVFVISESLSTGFDNVVQVDGNTVKLLYLPEDLIFVSI